MPVRKKVMISLNPDDLARVERLKYKYPDVNGDVSKLYRKALKTLEELDMINNSIGEIAVIDRNRNTVRLLDSGGYDDDDLERVWQSIQGTPGLAVKWFRPSDGQKAYWGSRGAQFQPEYTR